MGNASDGEIGELCLGGERPLEKTRRYRSYDTDVACLPPFFFFFGGGGNLPILYTCLIMA
jgi:hypothetical protein